MIYVTGDIHANPVRLSTDSFPEQKEMTKDDYVIILGDFGLVWDKEESKEEKYWLDWLESKPFTTLFISGNHENYDRLETYPVEEWNGGNIQRIRPSVIHLMRGQVFTLQGKKFFAFGGASSHDIQGGILEPDDSDYYEKKKKLDKGYLPYRINHVSWWKQELPTEQEMAIGMMNLEKNNNEVDYILTHCASSSTTALLGGGLYTQDILTEYLQKIQGTVNYRVWLFGHYHDNRRINGKEFLFYEQITRIL